MIQVRSFVGVDGHHVIAIGISLELNEFDFIGEAGLHRDTAEATR